MSWTLTTSGACIIKAGQNASSAITSSGAQLAQFSDETEAFLMVDGRYDWVTNYPSIKTTAKQALADVASDLIAMKIINYGFANYSTKEATTMLDVLRDNVERALKNLRDDKYREVMFI